MGVMSASAPLHETAEDSVPSSEGIDIALASDVSRPSTIYHLPLHPRWQGVLGSGPYAPMRGFSSPHRRDRFIIRIKVETYRPSAAARSRPHETRDADGFTTDHDETSKVVFKSDLILR